MECKYCKNNCTKAGKQKNGTQKYYCVACKKYQQLQYKYTACKAGIDTMVVKLVCNSVGIRGIGRVLSIAVNTVMHKIKKIAAGIAKPAIPLHRKSFEVDEVRTYIGNKENQYWVAYCLCGTTKEVIDFVVCKRNKRSLKTIIDGLLLSGVEKIKTDKLNIYQTLIPCEKHISNAYNINHIERNNLNIRTHIKRMSRRTICFSKSAVMLAACLRIYFWHQGNR